MITLWVGKLEIICGKNDFYKNFRDLFQPNDLKDIKYYYTETVIEIIKGYSRKLIIVKPRLDLLGFALENIIMIYESTYTEYCDVLCGYTDSVLTFEEFFNVFTKIDLSKVDTLTEDDISDSKNNPAPTNFPMLLSICSKLIETL